MSDKQPEPMLEEDSQQNVNSTNSSFQYEEYGELEQSLIPAFEFSFPISSISSNCSSPDRTPMADNQNYRRNIDNEFDENFEENTDDFVSLEELKSQISPPCDDDECSANTLTRHSNLETIFEDVYLETPPGTPTTSNGFQRSRKRRMATRMDLSKCEEFKENVQCIPE